MPELKSLSYEQCPRKLDMPTLSYRRSRRDMKETFKIASGDYNKDCTMGISKMRQTNTRSNTKMIFEKQSRLDKFNFRVVNN